MPVVAMIREHGFLRSVPQRTEADLYLWVTYHRERLAKRYGLAPLSPEEAVATFAETHSGRPVDRTVKSIRTGLHKTLGAKERPLGMSEDEFQQSKARHDAGEVSIGEAEQKLNEELAAKDGA